jgi:proteasome lid subunit RPN8/RPN11
MSIICQEILAQVVDHAKKHYPDEACGLLIGEKRNDSVSEFVPIKNIYNEMHERYPDNYPRTAKTAYLIDPMEQQRIFDEAEKNGMEVKSIYHSHTDHDAYFSEEDRLVATPWGEPTYPGVSYLVVSIYKGELKEINEFLWNESRKDFIENKVNF